jgi:hypothetical protein
MITVRCATDADAPLWDAFVAAHASLPVLYQYVWRHILRQSYGAPTHFFLALDVAGDIQGVCPTYVTRAIGAHPMLYGFRSGLLANDASVADALVSAIERWSRAQGVDAMLLSSDVQAFFGSRSPIEKTTLLLDLAPTDAAMLVTLGKKTRNMIRKAERSGVVVETSPNGLDALYRLYAARMIEKSVPMHRRSFFAHIVRCLGDDVRVFVARHDGRAVGALLLMVGERMGFYPYQASSHAGERVAATQLLIWEAMRFCAARGIPTLDMGESTQGSTVFQSKINFGGRASPVYSYRSLPQENVPSFFGERVAMKLLTTALTVGPSFIRYRAGLFLKARGRIL